jgi:hypothetical protein
MSQEKSGFNFFNCLTTSNQNVEMYTLLLVVNGEREGALHLDIVLRFFGLLQLSINRW